MSNRIITVVSTRGGRIEKFELAEDLKWGEVRETLREKYPDIEELAAVESVNKTTLSSVDSAVPNGNIRIFLRPNNTKAGHNFEDMSYAEIREFISDNGHIKPELNSMAQEKGKNWTQLSLEEFRYSLNKIFNQDLFQEEEENTSAPQKESFEDIANMMERNSNALIGDSDIEAIERISLICSKFINDYYNEMKEIEEDLFNLGYGGDKC